MSLEKRTVVISGASGGLGSALAIELAARQTNLVLLERNPEKLSPLLKRLALADESVLVHPVDLLDPAGARAVAAAAAARFGRVDVLLHLVGGWTGGKRLVETPASELEMMLNQHIWTSFNVIQAFVPLLVQNGWGRIIMISSPAAGRPAAKGGPYAAAKAGQEALLMALAQELKGSGVTANLLQVRNIDVKAEKVSAPTPENSGWTTPDEMASAVLYLLSDAAGVVNGTRLMMTGGQL